MPTRRQRTMASYADAHADHNVLPPFVWPAVGGTVVVAAYASLLTRQPSHLRVEALEPTQLFVLSWSEIDTLYARHVCWQIVGRRLAETQLVEREQRAHELLTASATERYRRFCETHRELLPRLHDYDIASYIGVTPVSLSRLRARGRTGPRRSRCSTSASPRCSAPTSRCRAG